MNTNKKVVGIIFSIAALFVLPFSLLGLKSNLVEAQEVNTIFKANVSSILSQSIQSCGTVNPNTAVLTNSGAVSGNHFSSCNIVVRSTTNAPGYNLMIQSIDGVQRHNGGGSWVYDRDNDGDVDGDDNFDIPYGDGVADGNTHLMQVKAENTLPTLPTLGSYNIPPTSGSIASPVEMNSSSSSTSQWGFAVPSGDTGTAPTGFDSSYSVNTSSSGTTHGKYAKVPTTASPIRQTATTASSEPTNVYFGVSVSPHQPTGVYQGTIVFTTTINPVPNPAPIVVAVYPDNGPLTGGTTLDVYGTNFTGATGVTIGGTTCTSLAVISDGHLTCTLPAKAAGSYAVVVTTTYGVSNNNVMYAYTATPTEPGPNPYEPSGGGDFEGFSIGDLSHIMSGSAGTGDTETSTSIEPLGRSVFENLAESIGDEDYNNLWFAIACGALLSALLIFLAFLLGRKWDVYVMDKLGDNRSEVIKILVEKVGLDVKDVVKSLEVLPALVVEGISKGDAKKIVELLENEKAKVEMVRHGREPDIDN